MKLSTDRILTTHVGSLPRPAELYDLLVAEDRGETGDKAALEAKTAAAVIGRSNPVSVSVFASGFSTCTNKRYSFCVSFPSDAVIPLTRRVP